MHLSLYQYIITIAGILFLLIGIVLYSRHGIKDRFLLAGIVISRETLGIIFFFLGMVLILSLLIMVLEPRFSPPGLEQS